MRLPLSTCKCGYAYARRVDTRLFFLFFRSVWSGVEGVSCCPYAKHISLSIEIPLNERDEKETLEKKASLTREIWLRVGMPCKHTPGIENGEHAERQHDVEKITED